MNSARYYVERLSLDPHPEGGYFKEMYRDRHLIRDDIYSRDFEGQRNLATAIYYLLESGQVSRFHRLKFDEIWFYHTGCPMIIHTIDKQGHHHATILGLDLEHEQSPQVLIPAGTIFGAEPLESHAFSLVSCVVTPGFDFRDFELFEADALTKIHPEHRDIIYRLNRKKDTD